jgi:predicted transport protein
MSDTLDKAWQTFIHNIETKTGKTIAQWVKIARTGGAKHAQMVKFLKTKYGLSHGYANFIALRALEDTEPAAGGSGDPVSAQYTGKKAELRPIYDAIITALKKFGDDIEVAPKKAYVSLRRNKQFASIQPTTATRVDVGLILKNEETGRRLKASGNFNAMFTHRVGLNTVKDVDAELIHWLKKAYAAA